MPETLLRIELLSIPRTVGYIDGVAKQLRFAIAKALNDTLVDVQQAIQAGMEERFELRRKTFNQRGIKIARGDFATKENLRARVHLDTRTGYLRKFEDGGVKTAPDPNMPIAIPSENIRPNFKDVVPMGMYPKALRLVDRRDVTGYLPAKRHTTKRGVPQIKGKRRTFVLDPNVHFGIKTWGVYQRTGPGRRDIRLLWTYKSKIPIPNRLRFVETARRVALERWPKNMGSAIAYALASAR